MSSDFDQWEEDFGYTDKLRDPLDIIVEESIDPMECAQILQQFVKDCSKELHLPMMRRGISKLGYKFYGPYLGREVIVAADGGFALPESDPARRKRDVLQPMQFEGEVFAIGKLATFLTAKYKNEETGEDRLQISATISEPHLAKDGRKVSSILLPDYMFFPISDVLSYKFEPEL